jgi:pimeloyl-ACP methyl ester carboxylesterase
MTSTTLIEHTVTVAGKPIFFAEAGDGPSVVMLHGGGPGASGVSNYSRNIDALAEHFRVVVPDMPGYGRSGKGWEKQDQSDPFGYLADTIRGLLDELGIRKAHLAGNSYGGAAALRMALDTPHRVDKLVLMGPGGIGTTRGAPTAGLKSLLSYYGGTGPSRDKLETFIRSYLVYDGACVPDSLIDTRYSASVDPEVVANPPLRRPSGLTQEIFTRPGIDDAPLSMAVRGGFVTGEAGIGHVAVTSTKPQQMRGYYDTVFDARLTDYIDETISGLKFKIRFLRVNHRHHSIAIAAVNPLPINPIRTRVQHVNIQVADLGDMTASYQRVQDLGFRLALAVGQHTNDRELSYYAVSPSGFEWEVGWNPIVVDEKTWEPTTYQGISIWGHTRQSQTVVEKLAQFKTAVQSLLHQEDTVPALAHAAIPDN